MKRLERDARGASVALELGQQRAQRVAAVQLVGAVGADDEHALVRAGCGRGRRGGRASSGRPSAGPRARAAPAAHGRGRRAATSSASNSRAWSTPGAAAGRRRAGQQRRDARRAPESSARRRPSGRAGAGRTRAARTAARLAEVDAVAGEHQRVPLARDALELGEQARLADARLAGHERDDGCSCGVSERRFQRGELGRAADEAGLETLLATIGVSLAPALTGAELPQPLELLPVARDAPLAVGGQREPRVRLLARRSASRSSPARRPRAWPGGSRGCPWSARSCAGGTGSPRR